ncbi:MAG: ABC transporter substrate-binding protein, partial [Desulfatiglandales bacterium]
DAACAEMEGWLLAQFESQNGQALEELVTKHNVQLLKFPDDVLKKLKEINQEVLEEEAKKDPLGIKVNEDFKKFQKLIGSWGAVSERAYYNQIAVGGGQSK